MTRLEQIDKIHATIRQGFGNRLTNSDTEIRLFAIGYLDVASSEEKQDLFAYIDWGHENAAEKSQISFNVMHDVGGRTEKRVCLPRSKGYHALMEGKGGEKCQVSSDTAQNAEASSIPTTKHS